MERCPSGRRSTPGKRVYVNSVSRVRIPLSPRIVFESIVASIGLFATLGCEPRQVRKEATVVTDACVEGRLVLATIGLTTKSWYHISNPQHLRCMNQSNRK